MNQHYDVTALGELLIDFTNNGISSQGNPLYEANPGGAPCNVLSMLQKLNRRTAFIGKVGNDFLGKLLSDKASAQGIDMSGLIKDNVYPTTLAFVQKLENGDRDFSFYRNPSADMMLNTGDVNKNSPLINNCTIFHFGSLSMTNETAEQATKAAIELALKSGALISFDPNYRAPLWESEEKAVEKIRYGLSVCDILKISDNEIELITGTSDTDKGVSILKKQYDIPLIFATLGPDGSKAYYKDLCVSHPGFKNPDTVETTGAGDTFCACALNFVLKYGISSLGKENLLELLTFANAAASLITTRKGALAVMPSKEEVREYIKRMG